jgi:hypothetical protein
MTGIQFALPISSFCGMVVSDKASQCRGCWFNTHGGEMLYYFFLSPARVLVMGEGAGSNLPVGKY